MNESIVTSEKVFNFIHKTCDINKENVTIGKNNYFHPFVYIASTQGGNIIIGDFNIFEEKISIINYTTKTIKIGSFNHFKSSVCIFDSNIGNYNILNPKCIIKGGTDIKNCNIIGSNTIILPLKIDIDELVILNNEIFRKNTDINKDEIKAKILIIQNIYKDSLKKLKQKELQKSTNKK